MTKAVSATGWLVPRTALQPPLLPKRQQQQEEEEHEQSLGRRAEESVGAAERWRPTWDTPDGAAPGERPRWARLLLPTSRRAIGATDQMHTHEDWRTTTTSSTRRRGRSPSRLAIRGSRPRCRCAVQVSWMPLGDWPQTWMIPRGYACSEGEMKIWIETRPLCDERVCEGGE